MASHPAPAVLVRVDCSTLLVLAFHWEARPRQQLQEQLERVCTWVGMRLTLLNNMLLHKMGLRGIPPPPTLVPAISLSADTVSPLLELAGAVDETQLSALLRYRGPMDEDGVSSMGVGVKSPELAVASSPATLRGGQRAFLRQSSEEGEAASSAYQVREVRVGSEGRQ